MSRLIATGNQHQTLANLDSEQSKEYIDITMCFFFSVIDRKDSRISPILLHNFSKDGSLDGNGTLFE